MQVRNPMDALPRVCVVFASRGRPTLLAAAVARLMQQTCRPTSVVVSCPHSDDAGPVRDLPDVTILCGASGLAAQRNAALRCVPADTDVVVFFDDDFVPRHDWISQAAAVLHGNPGVAAVTGALLADGIKGPGLAIADAEVLLAGSDAAEPWLRESSIPYGCNMAFRWSAVVGCRFDERLVLYGWLEDRDFGAALARGGHRIVKAGAMVGVHLGVKAGRVSGRRLGYSQVVNPVYLHRKGTMPLAAVADHLFRNLASNLVRALRPEPYIDRRGRLRGNLHGLADVLRGIIEPERAILQ
jgi:GT2 family glycosyltransferase